MNAAQAISAALDAHGVTIRRKQAALLDEDQATWSYCVSGRDPHMSKVWSWLVAAHAKGTSIRVAFDAEAGCTAVVTS